MKEIFEGIHVVAVDVPEGFSVNVMVVMDEEPAVVDTGRLDCAFDLLDRMEKVIPWEEVVFLAVASEGKEHLHGLEKFLAALSNVRVLALDLPGMRERLEVLAVGRPVWFVKEGQPIPLGRRRLRLFHLPLPALPEMAGVMVEPEGVLYSGELCSSLDAFEAEEPSKEGLRKAVSACLKSGGEGSRLVEATVKKALSLKPSVLVPAHGPICFSSPEGRLRAWLDLARGAKD